jgi:hypothetical protein
MAVCLLVVDPVQHVFFLRGLSICVAYLLLHAYSLTLIPYCSSQVTYIVFPRPCILLFPDPKLLLVHFIDTDKTFSLEVRISLLTEK